MKPLKFGVAAAIFLLFPSLESPSVQRDLFESLCPLISLLSEEAALGSPWLCSGRERTLVVVLRT